MIGRVSIKNFKSIGDPGVDLELKPLTLLVGPNGAGKSSILEAIAVASQRNVSGKLVAFPSSDTVRNRQCQAEVAIAVYYSTAAPGSRVGRETKLIPPEAMSTTTLLENMSVVNQPPNLNIDFQEKTFLLSSVRGDIPHSVTASGAPVWVGTPR